MTKQLQDHVDALTKKVRVKLVPKSTPTDKFVEKLVSKNRKDRGGMSASARKAAILRGC